RQQRFPRPGRGRGDTCVDAGFGPGPGQLPLPFLQRFAQAGHEALLGLHRGLRGGLALAQPGLSLAPEGLERQRGQCLPVAGLEQLPGVGLELGGAVAGRTRPQFQPLLAALLHQPAQAGLQVQIGLPQRHRQIGNLVHVVTSGDRCREQGARRGAGHGGRPPPCWPARARLALTAVNRGGHAGPIIGTGRCRGVCARWRGCPARRPGASVPTAFRSVPMPCRTTAALLLGACLALGACQRSPAPPAGAAADPAAPATPKPANDTPAGQRIEADVVALADDAMEGRETGTPGYDRAAGYVAERFAALGLEPAGDDGGWRQAVPLLKGTALAEGARLEVRRGGQAPALELRTQFLPGADFNRERSEVEAPAVFVGQAVHAPELGHDDFAGLDLRGKIAVVFGGAPGTFDDTRRAFHSSWREKLRNLVERGAIGAVMVNTADDEAR